VRGVGDVEIFHSCSHDTTVRETKHDSEGRLALAAGGEDLAATTGAARS
jgi:hypothetical protein